MNNSRDTTTIAALATAPVPAALAVVRVSGPLAKVSLRSIFKSKHDPATDPRRLVFGELIDFNTKAIIDQALAVFMPGPHSFTGEDIAEYQFHGSPLLVEKVLRSLFAFGVSPAEPGEFTRRAFLNGKLDLAQAEAIGDLIAASSEASLKLASEQLRGRFSAALAAVGEPLRELLAEVEAGIDFPDEDIEVESANRLRHRIESVGQTIDGLMHTYHYGHKVKDGYRVLLCGRPNVGKSSLLNALVGRERAIVTEISGTTRDLIEEECFIGGYRFIFCDTAGITQTEDKVERIGVQLARERYEWADLALVVVDAAESGSEWEEIVAELRAKSKLIWMVVNKIDLNPGAIGSIMCDTTVCAKNFYISAKNKDGIDQLTDALVGEVRSALPAINEANQIITNERHRSCLARAQASLSSAIDAIDESQPVEIIAGELRLALSALEEIVGRTYNEDILGRIFSKFCIGK